MVVYGLVRRVKKHWRDAEDIPPVCSCFCAGSFAFTQPEAQLKPSLLRNSFQSLCQMESRIVSKSAPRSATCPHFFPLPSCRLWWWRGPDRIPQRDAWAVSSWGSSAPIKRGLVLRLGACCSDRLISSSGCFSLVGLTAQSNPSPQ